MQEAAFFGAWIAQRRRQLDLTQRELAALIPCAVSTIKKVESGERRPSRELAESLAGVLKLPPERIPHFVETARGVRSVDSLASIGVSAPSARAQSDDTPHLARTLVGRTRERSEIAERLARPECRLLTLVGIGGSGKTRLALATADDQRDRFADGVAFVSLGALADGDLVPNAIAEQLGIATSSSTQTHLSAYLRDRAMLLVLDNCEQLRNGISRLTDWLADAPGLKILTTSRERLNLVDEWVYAVPPLEADEAARLFAQTARRLAPSFEPAKQADAIAAICRSVGGLPLALELAAGWTPILSAAEIAERLHHDLDLLKATEQNWPERHRTLRAVFDQTWRVLSADEQQALMRLSVFRGGWELAQVESIADVSAPVLRSLAARALVQIDGNARFTLHPLVQQDAADRLRASGHEVDARERHAEGFLALVSDWDAQQTTHEGIVAFSRLDRDQDNARAGLQWSFERGDVDRARRYFDKLSLYWWRRGHWSEGEQWARALDARPGEPDGTLLCWTLIDAAFFLTLQGHYAEAVAYMARAEAMAERLADPETTLRVLIVQAQAPVNLETAAFLYRQFFDTVPKMQTHSKSGGAAMEAAFHDIYGDRLREAGRNDEAAAEYRQSLSLWRRMGNLDAIAYPIGNLGRLALQAGQIDDAARLLHESVAITRAIGNRVGILDWLPHLGSVRLTQGDLEQAESCYDEALALCDEVGNGVAAAQASAYLGYCAYLNGDRARAREKVGRSLTLSRAIADTQPTLDVPWRALLPYEFVLAIQTLALVDLADGQLLDSVRGFGAAARWQLELSAGPDLGLHDRIEQALERLRHELAADVFEAGYQAGQTLTPVALIDSLS